MPEKPRKKSARTAKKKWKRPIIQTGQLFESNSLACGKNAPNTEECLQNPEQS
jgi:hypothetical protein